MKRSSSKSFFSVAVIASTALLTSCGSGGGGTSSSSTIPPVGASTPTPMPTLTPVPVTGKVVAIPAGSYGPTATQSTLSGAVVIVGPSLVIGATPPPTLPSGDVQATTDASGSYSVSLATAPVVPNAATNAAFIVPGLNLSGFTPPTSGYYISVFAVGADGKSANTTLPVHAFSAVTNGTLVTQRVTTATVDEAANLAYLNAARVKANPAAPVLIFDESAEETAREHVQDMAANKFLCHYDLKNVGPYSRYLRMSGLGVDGENVGFGSAGAPQAEYATMVDREIAQGPGEGHYENIINANNLWAGVSTAANSLGNISTDDELISPHATFFGTYTSLYCPTGILANGS